MSPSALRPTGASLLAGTVLAVVVAVAAVIPAAAQDVTTTTTVPVTEPATVAPDAQTDPVPQGETQTVVEAEPSEDRFLTGESRRIVVAVGGLVAVALALLLLTIRYWRYTKPVAPDPDQLDPEADDVGATAPTTAEVVVSDRASRRAVAGADHPEDESWEPLATGEHAVVDLPPQSHRARPSVEARRKVLGRT